MRAARVLFLVAFVGMFAVSAKAQVSNGDLADPHPIFVSPDPACTPPYCVNITFSSTGTGGLLFVFVPSNPPSGVPEPPENSCTLLYNDITPLHCFTAQTYGLNPDPPPFLTPTEFFGFYFWIPTTAGVTPTISISSSDGNVDLDLPQGWTCTASESCESGTIDVLPAPEPGTAPLFISGLVLLSLAGLARKRFGAGSVV